MKSTISLQNDYQNMFLLLVKEKLPAFLLGVWTATVVIFFLFQKPIINSFFPKTSLTNSKKIGFVDQVKTYTVKQGDDLWSISERFYGSGFNAYDIAQVNKLNEPYVLAESQVLIIPSIESKKPTQGEITPNAASTKRITEYVVGQGEFLWQIAEKMYGDGNQMSKIIDGNNLP